MSCWIDVVSVRPAARGDVHMGILSAGPLQVRCALGRAGMTWAKREGDGATPVGAWPINTILRRSDRIGHIPTGLTISDIHHDDGWCDDPGHRAYNRQIKRPFAASHERLWRRDHLYDVVVVLGYNRQPAVPGLGSAIFFHLASADYGPTQGCVAVARNDMFQILRLCGPGTRMVMSV